MNETDHDFEEILLIKLQKLSPEKQQRVLNYIDFLIWQANKRKSDVSDASDDSEMKNDN